MPVAAYCEYVPMAAHPVPARRNSVAVPDEFVLSVVTLAAWSVPSGATASASTGRWNVPASATHALPVYWKTG